MDAVNAKRAGNAKGGRSTSVAKIEAARMNGRKGGRPTKLSKMSPAEVAQQTMLEYQRAEAKKLRAEQRADAHQARIERLAHHVPQPKIPKPPKPKPRSTAQILLDRHAATQDGTLAAGETPCACGTCGLLRRDAAAANGHGRGGGFDGPVSRRRTPARNGTEGSQHPSRSGRHHPCPSSGERTA